MLVKRIDPGGVENVKRELQNLENHVGRKPCLSWVAWSRREGAKTATRGSASRNERPGFTSVGDDDRTAQRPPIPRAGHRPGVAGMLESLMPAAIRRAIVTLAVLTAFVTQTAVATPKLEITADCGNSNAALRSVVVDYTGVPTVGDTFKINMTNMTVCGEDNTSMGAAFAVYNNLVQAAVATSITTNLTVVEQRSADNTLLASIVTSRTKGTHTIGSITFTLLTVPTEPANFFVKAEHINLAFDSLSAV